MNKKLLKIGLIVLVFLFFVYFSLNGKNIKSLEVPLLKPLNEKSNGTLILNGVAYPKAKILIYINDQYVDDITVDENGSFTKTVNFDSEGIKKIKTKQTYKNISSNFSKEYSVTVDTTPPNRKLFKLYNLPEMTKANNILIKGVGSPNDYLILNGSKFVVSKTGTFEINYSLKEGPNDLEFSMQDEMGNKTDILDKRTILVDTISPEISSWAYGTSEATKELVVVNIGAWQSISSVPITGQIYGNIKSLSIDGKEITWDENKEIFQRISLPISIGLNKFKVVVEDIAGNISSGYVETTAVKSNNTLDVNIVN